uniref:cation transporter dimerization domain-containing protein n=1 Tax=Lysinibacillus sp. D4A1_S13 TaxID=2941228 RepID=UPI0024BF08EF
KESSHSLPDGFDVNHISDYKKTIEQIAGVSRLKDIKARYLGSSVHIDFVIEVPSDLNIKESHEIANEVDSMVKEEHA